VKIRAEMDLETENRIAAILMKEAAELRRRADKEGVHVYLDKPNVRGRPNSRFLTATVLGVQQANRAEEIREMWRVRQKEQELDDKHKGRYRDDNGESRKNSTSYNPDYDSSSSRKRVNRDISYSEEKGLSDEEIEDFLQSRVKRGRGDIGSRMDEIGPYLPPKSDSKDNQWEKRVVLGPQRPPSLNRYKSSDSDSESDSDSASDSRRDRRKERKASSSKKHSKKHKSKEVSKKDRKRMKEEKRRKRRK
jgi:hypothetical protein